MKFMKNKTAKKRNKTEKLYEAFQNTVKRDEELSKALRHIGKGKMFKIYLAGVRKGRSDKK